MSLSPQHLLDEFGYLAVFLGTFFEGEAILAIAGFFAQRKLLSIALVILFGFLGAFVGHIFWFWVGRKHATPLLNRFPALLKKFEKPNHLIERHGAAAVFITQYVYGIRLISAIVFGISSISTRSFLFYQAINCLIWANLIAFLGYFFGQAIEKVLGKAAAVEKVGLIALVVIGIGITVYHRVKEKRKRGEVGQGADLESGQGSGDEEAANVAYLAESVVDVEHQADELPTSRDRRDRMESRFRA